MLIVRKVTVYCLFKMFTVKVTVYLNRALLSFASQIGLGTDADLCRATDRATVTKELWLPYCVRVMFCIVFSLTSNDSDRCT